MVEGVHLRRAAVHVEEDHVARARREVRGTGRFAASFFGKQCRQRDGAEAVGAAEKHVAASQGSVEEASAVHGGVPSPVWLKPLGEPGALATGGLRSLRDY